jgi:hypothetical protein
MMDLELTMGLKSVLLKLLLLKSLAGLKSMVFKSIGLMALEATDVSCWTMMKLEAMDVL